MLIGGALMDQPLEPWASNGGTGVGAAGFSNQGEHVSQGPGTPFYFFSRDFCRCYVRDKELFCGQPAALGQS
jgi:hypothetical protein